MKKFFGELIKNRILTLIFFLIFFSFGEIFPPVNNIVNGTAAFLKGVTVAKNAGNNIILLKITDDDIDRLGWPLKRSYYALLIDRLEKLHVKAIGLSVFFPRGVPSQSIYNSLLFNELRKKYNVVLSAVALGLKEDGMEADTVKLPFFAGLDSNIPVGHLNYFNGEYLLIPNEITSSGKHYYSFAFKLAKLVKPDISAKKQLYLNVTYSWKKFKSYSVLKFFDLIERGKIKKEFSGKVVIIGVSAATISRTLYFYPFGDIPGIGIQALAVENILEGKWIDFKWFTPLKYLFWLALLIAAVFYPRKYWALAVVLSIAALAAYFAFNIAFDFSAIVLPSVAFLLLNFFNTYVHSLRNIKNIDYEKKRLEEELKKKIFELETLGKRFEKTTGSEREIQEEKINALKKEIEELKEARKDEEPATETDLVQTKNFEGIVFKSKKMLEVIEVIKKVAPSGVTVLITGESGSGKELVAKAIHNLSTRKNNPFVSLNCAAITESLLESELFGHVKGAFTNAVSEKKGLFEAANGGTIFLDEIGETSLNFQAKLLRVLQNGEYQKVGFTEKKFTDVRIIAATNKNLKRAVEQREFREDLFYRLNVVAIELPPLRKRKEDIPALAAHFLKNENPDLRFSRAIVEILPEYDWPGNVRELESVIKRAAVFAAGDKRSLITLKDLPPEIKRKSKESLTEEILQLLRQKEFEHSSIKEIAEELGLSRTAVSENLRGWFFEFMVKSDFNFDEACRMLAATGEGETLERVKSKGEKYISNIKNDIKKIGSKSFEEIKKSFGAKYKNLPQKFHGYLDAVIKRLIENDV